MGPACAGCGPSRPVVEAQLSHDGQISRGHRSGQLGCGCTFAAPVDVRPRQLGCGSQRLLVARYRPSAILGGTTVTADFDHGIQHARTSGNHAFGHRPDRARVSAALRWLFASGLISTRRGVLVPLGGRHAHPPRIATGMALAENLELAALSNRLASRTHDRGWAMCPGPLDQPSSDGDAPHGAGCSSLACSALNVGEQGLPVRAHASFIKLQCVRFAPVG